MCFHITAATRMQLPAEDLTPSLPCVFVLVYHEDKNVIKYTSRKLDEGKLKQMHELLTIDRTAGDASAD